jgi:hypothetical protein
MGTIPAAPADTMTTSEWVKPVPLEPSRGIGGRTRIRTLDPLIKSQLLYQLSYAP